MIDAFASQAHYLDHLCPVMAAIPESIRGIVYVAHEEWIPGVEARGLASERGRPASSDAPCLVASGRDIEAVRKPRPIALMEHGIGQTYDGDPEHPVFSNGYAGGEDRERVELFICPNRLVRNANAERYPDARYAVVGSPRLDQYARRKFRARRPRTVALSFHWPCGVIGEAGSCFPDYQAAIKELVADTTYKFLGHGHPRYHDVLFRWWRHLGIEVVADFDEIMERADIYVCDNSSTLYEFAATGRPVLTLSCERYRRNVSHGIRFWDLIPGLECPTPEHLFDTLTCAVVDPEMAREKRRAAVKATIGRVDGYASRRAAAALMQTR